jgi:hypothetical protein
MEQHQPEETHQESRRTAAQAFMESLDQLGQRLQACEDEYAELASASNLKAQSQPPPLCSQAIDAQALEDAAADIEQFMQMRQTKNASVSGSGSGSENPTSQG